ncbi:Protein CBG26829 [Caenorhabditis briggsae]|uniref:Protein CBG26829 n=1 Tax=Caenorhabditis briggsae TaxID=6238 RepID=B6IKD8_CAEBR|nr:Protein CBG26829 [Caenorhabditis briggsae]CAS00368.1 Protein CBG26829 [Caenorhabditis briggsae]
MKKVLGETNKTKSDLFSSTVPNIRSLLSQVQLPSNMGNIHKLRNGTDKISTTNDVIFTRDNIGRMKPYNQFVCDGFGQEFTEDLEASCTCAAREVLINLISLLDSTGPPIQRLLCLS